MEEKEKIGGKSLEEAFGEGKSLEEEFTDKELEEKKKSELKSEVV
jgi:hypothetical protein